MRRPVRTILLACAVALMASATALAKSPLQVESSHGGPDAQINVEATFPTSPCPTGDAVTFAWGSKDVPLNAGSPARFKSTANGCVAIATVKPPAQDSSPGKYKISATDTQGTEFGTVEYTIDGPGPLPWLKPVGDVIRFPFDISIGYLYRLFSNVPVIRTIGAYGLAIIFVTVAVKLILFPLYQTQLRLSRKTQDEQRKIKPQLDALRKKYKGKTTSQEFIQAQQELYREHGINPMGPLLGCLPTLAQFPVLIGLYQAMFNHTFLPPFAAQHFLGLNLGISATLNNPITWLLPLLAGATTYVQSKMFAPPPPPPEEQDSQAAQMQQMTQSMSLIMPVMIVFFGFQGYAKQGLVLYWIVSNLFSIGQQYTVNGWGQLPFLGKPAGALAGTSSAGSNGAGKGAAQTTTVARPKQYAGGGRRRGRRR